MLFPKRKKKYSFAIVTLKCIKSHNICPFLLSSLPPTQSTQSNSPFFNMPREPACTYYHCEKDLLRRGGAVTKAEKNHVAGYHSNQPMNFICRHTNRQTTFNRQIAKDMDFVCYCEATFTLNSSLTRHYQLCRVARATALRALPRVSTPIPCEGRATPPHSPSTSSSNIGASCVPASVNEAAESKVGRQLEAMMIEIYQAFLEDFTEHTTTQTTKFVASLTENHASFLQAFTTAQAEQNTSLQRALADQYLLAFDQQHAYLESQQRSQKQMLLEQKRTTAAIRAILLAKRER